MASRQNTKIRLVKCPKCRRLLPESADLPVYKCGGCGTILQAKIRRNDARNTKLDLPAVTDIVHSSELEHVSEDKGSSSTSQNGNQLSVEKCSLGQNESGRDQVEVLNFPKEVSSSAELTCHENVDSSIVAGGNSEIDTSSSNLESSSSDNLLSVEKCSLGQNESGRDQVEVLNFPKEVYSSSELTCHENVDSSIVAGGNFEIDKSSSNLESSSGDDLLSVEKCSLGQNESGRDQVEVLNFPKEVSSSSELTCHENVDSSIVAGGNSEIDTSSSNLESSSSDDLQATGIRRLETTADKPVVESTASSALVSPSHEQLEQSQKSAVHGFDRVRSTDTWGTTDLTNRSSELSDALGDLPKSPTTRSAHAYDGSISSCDGTDDQVPDPHLYLYRKTFEAGEFVGVQESLERCKFPVNNNTVGRNVEMQHQARNSFSSDKKHYAANYSAWDSDEPMEPPRHGHHMRLNDDESPMVPFYLRSSQAGFKNGSPSSHWHDEFQCNSSFCSPDNPEHPEWEKIKLLRMVYDLQDQLDRTHIARGHANPKVPTGAAWKGKQYPTHNNYEAPVEEIYRDLSYPRYPRRCRQGENWPPHQSRFSQMPFSGEDTNRRLRDDHPYLCCYPPDWQCSGQLPPPDCCCNKGMSRAPLGHNCYSAHNSHPLTPPSHMNSEAPLRDPYMDSHFSWRGRDARSDDQRHKEDGEKKFHLREKHHLVKRHFRPIAGGAPFITCYHCLKPLKLPEDFLLRKRRCHQLRCGACSKVLKFSLQSSNHILPYAPGAIEPSSSEVDDSVYAINRRNLASASASETNDCPHSDPVSCSDDYGGRTFHKSFSTEGEHVSLRPPLGSADHRHMSSGSSFGPVEERKKTLLFKQSVNKYKNPVNTYEAAGRSSKMFDMQKRSSEIEEVIPKTGSPLHRLMGYNSPSQVIKGSGEGMNLYK